MKEVKEKMEELLYKSDKIVKILKTGLEKEFPTTITKEELEKRWTDKIKAKIEEVKDGTYDAKIVLQSLLEKE